MKYAVNDEGISALKGMAKTITDAREEINNHAQQLKAVGEGQDLGPHVESIIAAAESIENAVNGAAEPIEEIAEILEDVADGYEEIIGNDGIRNAMGN